LFFFLRANCRKKFAQKGSAAVGGPLARGEKKKKGGGAALWPGGDRGGGGWGGGGNHRGVWAGPAVPKKGGGKEKSVYF